MNWIKTSLIVVLIAIIYLSLRAPSESFQIRWNDKLGHLLAYTVLTVNIGLLLNRNKQKFAPIIAFTVSTILEYLQGFVPGRSVEWADLVANAIGATIGFILLLLLYNNIIQLLKYLRIIKNESIKKGEH